MAEAPKDTLAFEVGGAAVTEHLRRAVEAGELVRHADLALEVAAERGRHGAWMYVRQGEQPGCEFLMRFAFRHAYGQAATPHGCLACYKVRVVPRTLRELIAAWGLARRFEVPSKWGIGPGGYAGYFYVTSQDAALDLATTVRAAMDAEPRLGSDVPLATSRGCSAYEIALGPAAYAVILGLDAVEAELKARHRPQPRRARMNAPLAQWINYAASVGDETYLDCTGGRRVGSAEGAGVG